MSSGNLDNEQSQDNASFWEIGGYKANVYRIRDGYDQLEDLTKLLKERVDIEDKYGKSLQGWSQKWQNYAERNLPGGILKDYLHGVLLEGKELSRIHLSVKDRLSDEVVKTVGAFKDSSYHRSAIRGLKEQRDIEDKFEKAQSRWKKLWKKLDHAKKNYHNCCRAEKSSYIQMINSQADLTAIASNENADKSQERHERCCEETKKSKQIYQERLNEVLYENKAYVDKMSCVFEECQQFEFVRMKFIIEMISGMQKVFVDLAAPSKLQSVHNNLESKFKSLGDAQLKQDLKSWSHVFGTDVPHQVPSFENTAPDIHNISSKPSDPQDCGVILTKKILLKSDSVDDANEFQLDDCSSVDNLSLNNKPSVKVNQENVNRRKASTSGHDFVTNKECRSTQSSNSNNIPGCDKIKHLACIANNSIAIKRQQSDPLTDPFPMQTPKKSVEEVSTELKKLENKPPPYHVYAASKLNEKLNESDKHELVVDPIDPAPARDMSEQKARNALNENYNCFISTTNAEIRKDNSALNTVDQKNGNNATEFLGEKVVALFDYKPNEPDEIALVKGEVIEMFRSADDMGWCYGRKDDKIGFFPAGYVSKCS